MKKYVTILFQRNVDTDECTDLVGVFVNRETAEKSAIALNEMLGIEPDNFYDYEFSEFELDHNYYL